MPRLTREMRKAGLLESGMWVMHAQGIGIIFAMNGAACKVHLVAEDGTTKEEVLADVDQLRQARLHEIPKSRKPAPATAAKFGYE